MKKVSEDRNTDLDKIIIQSDELKKKVRIRVPKSTVAGKKTPEMRVASSKKVSDKKTSDKKYFKLGTLQKVTSKKEASDFRKKSAHWRDGEKYNEFDAASLKNEPVTKNADKESALYNESGLIADEPTFFEKMKSFSPMQWACVGMAVVIFATSIMTTGVYANYKGEQNKAIAFSNLPKYEDMNDRELAAITEEVVEDVEPIALEEPQEVTGQMLSLVLTSVEKDLKIKLIDEEDTLVKGVNWGVTVADSKNNTSTYDDEDTDGIIHITDISAGDYSVTINSSDSLNGYTIPSTASQVSVKAKVEYKVIANIKDEIKSEKEVNAAAEDANGNQAADVETGTKLTDTVEWCESTKTESGEKYTEASVDLSKCEVAKRSLGDYIKGALKGMAQGTKSSNGISLAAMRLVAVEEGAGGSEGGGDQGGGDNGDSGETGGSETGNGGESGGQGDGGNSGEGSGESGNAGGETHSHNYNVITSNGDGTHKVACSCGDVKIANEACTYGDDNKCKTCGAEKKSEDAGTAAVTGVKLDQTAMSLVVGKTGTLKATVEPSNASNTSVTWSSSNSSVATVNGGTVTAVAAGTAKITATADGGKTAVCEVTVAAADKKYKPTSKLFDSSNNQLYKKSGDSYVLATYQDILDGVKQFFRKEAGYIYTGWQTIDNQTYYYKSDHTYVTGDQVIGGVLYHFGSDGTLTKGSGTLGIDVSKYQPSINWASVKASGISYVIIRCGYRGASTGALIQDPYFTSHIKGAKAAGLKVGVYFFSTALTEAEAVEEASMCAALCSGYGVNYPVFIDVESSSRPGYNGLPAAQRTANIKAFCNTIKSAGYTPGVYANKTWFTSYINTSQLSGYKIWLAQYNAAGPTYSGRYDLWQYTSKGSVNGIPGNVDMNQSYLGY